MAKKKLRFLGGKHFIIISSIIALNAFGVSYAYWNDQLQINTILKTGRIGPAFCNEDYWINIVRDGSDKGNVPSWDDNHKGINESALSDLRIDFDDKHQTMYINGTLEEGYKAFIHYCLVNNGTIPVKYVKNISKESNQEELEIQDGLKVQLNQQSEVLEPQEKLYTEHSNGNPKIQVQAPNLPKEKDQLNNKDESGTEEAKYSFEIKLPFKQWTWDKSSNGGDDDEG